MPILPTTEPELIIHDEASWNATISQLRKHWREDSKPANYDYIVCSRTIPTASNGAEAFPDIYYMLKEATLRADLALVKKIYEEEWLPYTATGRFSNEDLYNVFCEALSAGQTSVVAFLLSQNVPFQKHHPEIAVEKGMDSLLRVLNNRPLCEWFLSHGADPNVQCSYGWTPLTTAVESASRDVIDLLFEHGGSIEYGQLIHAAARRTLPDCLKVIQMLLDKGCNINTIQYHNHKLSYGHWNNFMALGTPLHTAAENGRIDMVKFLLDHGADPKLRDTWGFLPIDKAKNKNCTEVVDLLKSYSYPRPEVTAAL